MAINKVDINLTNALNEDNIDGTYGAFIPKNRYTEFSDYLSQNLNIYEKTVGVKNPRCKVVKVIEGTGLIPQVASYSWTRTNTQELSTNKMRIIQAKVICPNGPRGVVPYPSDVVNPSIENQDPFITSLHTTAFLEFDSTKNQIELAPLDEVIIEYVGNDRSEAKILEVFRINNRTAQSNEPNPQTAFNNSDGTTLGNTKIQKTTGPNKDDPSFATCKASTYPNLQKKTTTFPKYTEQQVIDAIKQATSDSIIRKMCFSIISIEQPNYSFPNNNVAGIQLDGGRFPNTTESDFDYQTCFRDGGGDQRIFAGFNTLQKGMVVFSKIIQGKVNGGSFKTLTGDLENQSSIMADNYYRSWNLRATEAELTELKRNGSFNRKGKIIKPSTAYGTAKSKFKSKLGLIE